MSPTPPTPTGATTWLRGSLDKCRRALLKPPARKLAMPLAQGLRKAASWAIKAANLAGPDPRFAELRRWAADKGDEGLRLDYPLDGSSVVLDVGGYKGQWASDIYARYNCTVYVFEPIPEFAQRIRERFAGNPKVIVFADALTAVEAPLQLSLAADASSAFGAAGPQLSCSTRTLRRFLEETGVKRIDLLKLNIEGGEYELLEGMLKEGHLTLVDHLQIQFHDVAPDSAERMNRIRIGLARTHIQDWCYEFVWEGWHAKQSQTPRDGTRRS